MLLEWLEFSFGLFYEDSCTGGHCFFLLLLFFSFFNFHCYVNGLEIIIRIIIISRSSSRSSSAVVAVAVTALKVSHL